MSTEEIKKEFPGNPDVQGVIARCRKQDCDLYHREGTTRCLITGDQSLKFCVYWYQWELLRLRRQIEVDCD